MKTFMCIFFKINGPKGNTKNNNSINSSTIFNLTTNSHKLLPRAWKNPLPTIKSSPPPSPINPKLIKYLTHWQQKTNSKSKKSTINTLSPSSTSKITSVPAKSYQSTLLRTRAKWSIPKAITSNPTITIAEVKKIFRTLRVVPTNTWQSYRFTRSK